MAAAIMVRMRALLSACAASLALLLPAAVLAQPDNKTCVVLLVHGKGASAQALNGLAARLKPACLARAPEMPWSAKRGDASADASAELQKQVKELRAQGFKRVLLAGQGSGANAAMAYAGKVGDIEGVVAIGAADEPGLAAAASGIRQHVPLLFVVGTADALHAKGEAYAYAKAPPHPSSRYVALKADPASLADAAAKSIMEFAKSLE